MNRRVNYRLNECKRCLDLREYFCYCLLRISSFWILPWLNLSFLQMEFQLAVLPFHNSRRLIRVFQDFVPLKWMDVKSCNHHSKIKSIFRPFRDYLRGFYIYWKVYQSYLENLYTWNLNHFSLCRNLVCNQSIFDSFKGFLIYQHLVRSY